MAAVKEISELLVDRARCGVSERDIVLPVVNEGKRGMAVRVECTYRPPQVV